MFSSQCYDDDTEAAASLGCKNIVWFQRVSIVIFEEIECKLKLSGLVNLVVIRRKKWKR